MPKYQVNARVTISILTEVEADNPKEAKRIALGRPLVGLCHQCGGSDTADEEWCTGGELDGEPYDLDAEKID